MMRLPSGLGRHEGVVVNNDAFVIELFSQTDLAIEGL